jgi:hypothetical protein
MPTILYRVTSMPQCEGWNAPQAPGTFLFDFKSVVERYRSLVKGDLPYVHMHSRRGGVYRHYLEQVEALAWLERKWLGYYQNEIDEVVPWPDNFGSFCLSCSSLLLAKDFVSVVCPSCEASYSPEQVKVLEFQFGEELCAHGGRGLLWSRARMPSRAIMSPGARSIGTLGR